jgi:hypothetical protein
LQEAGHLTGPMMSLGRARGPHPPRKRPGYSIGHLRVVGARVDRRSVLDYSRAGAWVFFPCRLRRSRRDRRDIFLKMHELLIGDDLQRGR